MSEPSRPPSEAAYADLVAAVLTLRADAASDRFDAVLAELTAGGLLDPAAARELRWWQRESVRAVGDHLVDTVPASLVALDRSKAAAVEATAMADQAWSLATPPQPPSPDPQDPSLVVDLRRDESDEEPESQDGDGHWTSANVTVGGNCIFLNTEMLNGRTGCSLYHVATRLGVDRMGRARVCDARTAHRFRRSCLMRG